MAAFSWVMLQDLGCSGSVKHTEEEEGKVTSEVEGALPQREGSVSSWAEPFLEAST